jgi:hypothetical protein
MDIHLQAKRVLTKTKEQIDAIGPRLAGTKSSQECSLLLKKEMSEFFEAVQIESFTFHKGAFLGWIKILVVLYIISVVLLWINLPFVSFILLFIGIIIMVFEFFLYRHFIDWIYPKRTGYNVVGTIEPISTVKQQIIISGHHDSARIFNFFIHQPKLYNIRVSGGISLIFLSLVFSIILLFSNSVMLPLIFKVIATIGIFLTGQMWFFASKKGTPGAGDNLVSSNLAIEIGKQFKHKQLLHTRLIVVSFDAEEEGLRGSHAFAKKHQKEFSSIPTFALNTDCPYHKNELFFLTSDINNSVNLSQKLAEELVDLSETLGIFTFHQPITFLTGGTDAGELAKVGVSATTAMGMPWTNNNREAVYHTPNDTIDKVDIEAIKALLSIYTKYILLSDGKQ